MVDKLEVERIVRSAINRALRAEVDPVLSFKIEHRQRERNAAVADAVAALIATPANGEQVERVLNPVGLREAIARYALEDKWAEDEQDSLHIADEVLQLVHSYQTHSLANPTPTEDARSRVKVLEEALERIAKLPTEVDARYYAPRIARNALGNKETDRHG